MGQVASGMANMGMMSGGPDLRNQKLNYNTKFGTATSNKSGADLKNTPQSMLSSKVAAAMK